MTTACSYDDPEDQDLETRSRWLRRLAQRLVGDPSAADDVVQDAWLAADRADGREGGTERGSRPGRMAAFITHVARRQLRGERRRADRERRAARPEAVPGPDEVVEALECQQILLDELRGLPAELCELLVLRTYAERSAAEIARARGLPASTVRDRLRRAEALLRERLDRRFGGRRELWAAPLLCLPREPIGAGVAGGIASPGALSTAIVHMKTSTKLALFAVPLLALAVHLGLPEPDRAGDGAPGGETEALLESVVAQPVVPNTSVRTPIVSERAPEGTSAVPGPFALLVRDAATQSVAPDYLVELLGEGGESLGRVRTDDLGKALVPSELASRVARLRALDHEDLSLSKPAEVALPRSPFAVPFVFEVELGPSYDLLLPEPPPPASATAFLAATEFWPDLLGQRWFERGAPLRRGARTWVRFDPEEGRRQALGGGRTFLSVRDREGHWQAWGEVSTVRGHAPLPVALEGGALGAVTGRVTVDGAAPTAPISVHLARSGEDLDPARDLRPLFVGAQGQWRAGDLEAVYLAPGPWSAEFSGPGLERARIDLTVRAGETRELEVELQRSDVGRRVEVLVESESGSAPLGFLSVVARRVDGTGEPVHVLPTGAMREGAVRLVLEGLSPGRWRVALQGTGGLAPFAPAGSVEIDASVGEMRFVCLDRGVDWAPRGLVVRSAGGRIADAAVTVWFDGVEHVTRGLVEGHGELPPFHPEARMDVAVHAVGHRAVLLRDVQPVGDAPLTIDLEVGWGTVLVARAVEREITPLAGVRVAMNGVVEGVTDSAGRLLLGAERPPAAIRCELAGWRVFAGALDPTSGALTQATSVRTSDVLFTRE
jgi:RNA polymerase sigma factor (sigma-70 family)